MNICIIGAGMAGLCCARRVVEYGFKPKIYEKSDNIGGTWVYNNVVDSSSNAEVHSSMYSNLRTNLPKEVMGFPELPVPQCNRSYISSEEMLSFLESYASAQKLNSFIKFNTSVIRVHHVRNLYQVTTKAVSGNKINTEYYDLALVCNGHYNTPRFPRIIGRNLFCGIQVHSHLYRNPKCFEDQFVLVIGAGPSGLDLSNTISKSARRVSLSHHSTEIEIGSLKNVIVQKPDVTKLNETGAYFLDGTYDDFDIIVYCTGYKYSFPFITTDCGIYVENNYVRLLYKHCINISSPSMALVGLPFYICSTHMMDIQARFILQFYFGKKLIPSQEIMRSDTEMHMQMHWAKGYRKHQAHIMGENQMDYFSQLAATGNINPVEEVMCRLHYESSLSFNRNTAEFREDIYRIVDDKIFVKIN